MGGKQKKTPKEGQEEIKTKKKKKEKPH